MTAQLKCLHIRKRTYCDSDTSITRKNSNALKSFHKYFFFFIKHRSEACYTYLHLSCTFSFFLLAIILSSPLKAPEATNRMLVVSTWTLSPRSLREFFSGTFTIVPSSIFSIPCRHKGSPDLGNSKDLAHD